MWQKRTEQEIVEIENRTNRRRRYVAVFAGIFSIWMLLFTPNKWWLHRSTHYISEKEMRVQGPFALIVGVIVVWIFLRFPLPKKRTMVCLHCDKAKNDDGVMTCSCGGSFVDIETVKWVD